MGLIVGAGAFVVSIAALLRPGRRPVGTAASAPRRGLWIPLPLIVVAIAAATTGGALYASEAGKATSRHVTLPPVWWRITYVPHGAAARTEAPPKPAVLPPVAKGKVVKLNITVEDKTIDIAPGVRVNAWTFNGQVPAPTIHLRVGQTVKVHFVNHGTTWHSFDSHDAELPYQHANQDIGVDQAKEFVYVARRPGAFLYHCFTFPGAVHIAAGMFGAIIVDDPKHPLPKASRTFVLDASEWYLDGDGQTVPANTDPEKAQSGFPDYATFNGYWQEYSYRPFNVPVNRLVRFYVINAGPNFGVAFHVVGGIFTRAYPDANVSHSESWVQSSEVAPGGAGIFDIKFPKAGVYNFVNHVFSNAVKGQLGEIVVGNPKS